jgi:hypothetical protein
MRFLSLVTAAQGHCARAVILCSIAESLRSQSGPVMIPRLQAHLEELNANHPLLPVEGAWPKISTNVLYGLYPCSLKESSTLLFERAQELSGANLSSAIVRSLRRFIEIENDSDDSRLT